MARPEEKTADDFRARLEAELSDLKQFRLPQVGPDGPEPQPGNFFRAMGWAVYVAAAGEAISTEFNLSREGGQELNPLVRNAAIRIPIHIVVPIVLNKVTELDWKAGHKKRALWARIAYAAFYGVLTANNIRVARVGGQR